MLGLQYSMSIKGFSRNSITHAFQTMHFTYVFFQNACIMCAKTYEKRIVSIHALM